MRNTKKTTKKPTRFRLPDYTTPGVFPLFEIQDGLEKAVIVFDVENDYFLESFKIFYDFLIESSPLDVHLTLAKFYLKRLESKAPDTKIFDNEEERYDFDALIEFLAMLSVEHRQSILNKNIKMRTCLNEKSTVMRNYIDSKSKHKPNN
ncbi:hypothetical protein [Pedobacter sp. Leaf250]|uniref:hypothetical protein n=1 Tax=Pedobacter sp. Leaf250 TaxID=2876559 RepID=UPI001E471346|nr:hypothetical protein [Pedobacter sp. Leaf250]